MPTVNLTDAETALCAELAAETGLPPLLVSRFRQMWVTREAPFFAAVSEATDTRACAALAERALGRAGGVGGGLRLDGARHVRRGRRRRLRGLRPRLRPDARARVRRRAAVRVRRLRPRRRREAGAGRVPRGARGDAGAAGARRHGDQPRPRGAAAGRGDRRRPHARPVSVLCVALGRDDPRLLRLHDARARLLRAALAARPRGGGGGGGGGRRGAAARAWRARARRGGDGGAARRRGSKGGGGCAAAKAAGDEEVAAAVEVFGVEFVEALEACKSTPEERAARCKDQGNALLGERPGGPAKAAAKYTEGLDEGGRDAALNAALLCNRAAAELMQYNWGRALADATAALALEALPPEAELKACSRGARAAVKIEKPDEALELPRAAATSSRRSGARRGRAEAAPRSAPSTSAERSRAERRGAAPAAAAEPPAWRRAAWRWRRGRTRRWPTRTSASSELARVMQIAEVRRLRAGRSSSTPRRRSPISSRTSATTRRWRRTSRRCSARRARTRPAGTPEYRSGGGVQARRQGGGGARARRQAAAAAARRAPAQRPRRPRHPDDTRPRRRLAVRGASFAGGVPKREERGDGLLVFIDAFPYCWLSSSSADRLPIGRASTACGTSRRRSSAAALADLRRSALEAAGGLIDSTPRQVPCRPPLVSACRSSSSRTELEAKIDD